MDQMEMFSRVGGRLYCVALQMGGILAPDGDFNYTLNLQPWRKIGRQVLQD